MGGGDAVRVTAGVREGDAVAADRDARVMVAGAGVSRGASTVAEDVGSSAGRGVADAGGRASGGGDAASPLVRVEVVRQPATATSSRSNSARDIWLPHVCDTAGAGCGPRALWRLRGQQFSFWKWVVAWRANCCARTALRSIRTHHPVPVLAAHRGLRQAKSSLDEVELDDRVLSFLLFGPRYGRKITETTKPNS